MKRSSAITLIALSLGLASCMTSTTSTTARVGSIRSSNATANRGLNQRELQDELMRYSDGLLTAIAAGADELESQLASSDGRLLARDYKVRFCTAAINIASGPNPTVNLLDMTVLVTLARLRLEDYWQPHVLLERGAGILRIHQTLETQIWALAARVLTAEQQTELRALITEWQKGHPEERNIWFVHFTDFVENRPRDTASSPRSLLHLLYIDPFANLDPTAREIEKSRNLAERTAYNLQRLPTILRWQVDALLAQIGAAPELQSALATGDRISRSLEALPKQFAAERQQILDQLASQEGPLKEVLAQFQQTLKTGAETAGAVDAAARSMDGLVARFDKKPAQPGARPFNINEYHETAAEITTGARELRQTIESFNQLLNSPQATRLADDVEARSQRLFIRAFWLGVILIVILLTGLLVVLLTYRRLMQPSVPLPAKTT